LYLDLERRVKMKRILVPVDGSPLAKRACQVAKNLASKFDSEIILVTVVTKPARVVRDGLMGYMDDEVARKVEVAEKMLLEIKEDFEDMSEKVEIQALVGDIAGEILACANREQADLIVMGSRGLGVFSGAILGSISTKIVHSSEVSVLIVK
jgi:nucleotide-binding universal stress UspA family protein